MAPFTAIRRAAVARLLFLLSIATSFIYGQSDLLIVTKPLAFTSGTAVSVTWKQQKSDFDSLYCVVFVDSGEAVEELSSGQIIHEALLATGQAAGEEAEITTTPAIELQEPAPETTPAPVEAPGSTDAQEEAQLRSSKCKAISSRDDCSGDCEWHRSSPENLDEAGPYTEAQNGGECDLNAVVALQLLGEGDSKIQPAEGSSGAKESQAPLRRTRQVTTHAVERLRRAAGRLFEKRKRRLDEETEAGSAIAAIAEGKPLKACSPSAPLELDKALPDPCIDADKHRAHFFFQGKLVPDEMYLAYCATRKGASAQAFFNLDVADQVSTLPPEHSSSTSAPAAGTAAPVNSSAPLSNATSRGPRAAGGNTLDDEGEVNDPMKLLGGLYGGASVLLMFGACVFLVRRQQGARGIGGLLTQDHEMLQTSASTSGSYVGPGDLSSAFESLKGDGPE